MLESLLNSDAPEEREEQIEEIGVEIEELCLYDIDMTVILQIVIWPVYILK